MNILVVNQDHATIHDLRARLEGLGHDVDTVSGLDDALDRLGCATPSVLILDQDTPECVSQPLQGWIDKARRGRHLYCLMMTSSESLAGEGALLDAGIDEIVSKPVRTLELSSRLRSAERYLSLQSQLQARNRDLQLAYESLQGEYESLSSDLVMASTVQQALLPEPGEFSKLCAQGFLRAAQHMAGDSYDYFRLGNHHLAFYLADVVGHGSAAALVSFALNHQITPRARGLCQTRLDEAGSLDEAVVRTVQDLNDQFSHDSEHNRWFTMIYGLVDLRSGEVALCQAGHPAGLHYQRSNGQVVEVGHGGFPVGMFQDVPYTSVRCRLEAGDRLMLCSDGALECLSMDDEEFGSERMKQLIAEHRESSLDQLISGIEQRLLSWHQDDSFEDDVSVLVFEHAG